MLVPGPEAERGVLEVRDTADSALRAVCRLSHPEEYVVPVFAPDGRTFAVCFGRHVIRRDPVLERLNRFVGVPAVVPRQYEVQLFATDTGAERGTRTVAGDDVSLLGFAPDGASFWTAARTTDPATGDAVRLVERWAVPSPSPPAWLLTVTALGLLLAVADHRYSRRRRTAGGAS